MLNDRSIPPLLWAVLARQSSAAVVMFSSQEPVVYDWWSRAVGGRFTYEFIGFGRIYDCGKASCSAQGLGNSQICGNWQALCDVQLGSLVRV